MAEILHDSRPYSDPNVRTNIAGLEPDGSLADFTEVVPGLFTRQPMFDPRNILDLKAEIEHAQGVDKAEMFSPYDASPYGRGDVEGYADIGDHSRQIRDRLIDEHVQTGMGGKEFSKLTDSEKEGLQQAVLGQIGRSYEDLEKAVANEDNLGKRNAHKGLEKLKQSEAPDVQDNKNEESDNLEQGDNMRDNSLSRLAGAIAINAVEPQIMIMGRSVENLEMTMGPGGQTSDFTMGRRGITELGGVAAPDQRRTRVSQEVGESTESDQEHGNDDNDIRNGNGSTVVPSTSQGRAILGTMGTPLGVDTSPGNLHGYIRHKVAEEAALPQEDTEESNKSIGMTMGTGGQTGDFTMGRPAKDLAMTMGTGGITELGGVAAPGMGQAPERAKRSMVDISDVSSLMIDKPFDRVSEAELQSYRKQASLQSLHPALKGIAVRVNGDTIAYRNGKRLAINGDTHELPADYLLAAALKLQAA